MATVSASTHKLTSDGKIGQIGTTTFDDAALGTKLI